MSNKDLYVLQGSDFAFNLQVEVLTIPGEEYCSARNPYIPKDLSLFKAKMTVHVDYYSPALLTFTERNYIVLDSQGNIKIAITGSHTDGLILPDEINEYVYQLEISDTTETKQVCKGNFIITKNLNL